MFKCESFTSLLTVGEGVMCVGLLVTIGYFNK